VQNHFQVDVRSHRGAVVLAVEGELDLASSPALEAQLESAGESELVILDLRKLDFMDSTGLRVLLQAYQRAEGSGRRFALVRGGPQVQRLLSLAGVAERLTVVDAPEELLDGG
jgi:anti-sigma B factor antagonist